MKKISVILTVYNEERFLPRTLESIIHQTFKDFELIIVDDGSTDDSPRILSEYSALDKRIRLIRQENAGLTVSLNHGLALAEADVVARHDANDHSFPQRFELQYDYLLRNPECVLVGSAVEIMDDEDQSIVTVNNSGIRDFKKKLTRANPFCHGSIMFRRLVGGIPVRYDEFYRKAQDYDLIARLALQGNVAILPETLYRWRFSQYGILASNVTVYGELARNNHARRLRGLGDEKTSPAPQETRPKPSKSHFLAALGSFYLAGYKTNKARACLTRALLHAILDGESVQGPLRLLVMSLLPIFVLQRLREK